MPSLLASILAISIAAIFDTDPHYMPAIFLIVMIMGSSIQIYANDKLYKMY